MEETRLYIKQPKIAYDHGFQEVTSWKDTIFNKPTILCCGGTTCTHSHIEKANGFTKIAKALLNLNGLNDTSIFQIAAVTYPDANCVSESIKAYNRRQLSPKLYEDFVDTHIVPLFTSSRGDKLPLKQIKKNFSNINVFAYSYGGIFIQQVGNLLHDKMSKRGFSEEEIQDAAQYIKVLSVGSVADYGTGKCKFTQINLLHLNDVVAKGYSKNVSMGQFLAEERGTLDHSLSATKFTVENGGYTVKVDDQSREMLFTFNPTQHTSPVAIRHNDAKCCDTFDEMNPIEISEPKFHEVETYFYHSITENGLLGRSIMSTVLTNVLNCSIKQHFNDHLLPLPSVEDLVHISGRHRPQSTNISDHVPAWRAFTFKDDKDFHKVSRVIGYQPRVNAALVGEKFQDKSSSPYLS